MSNKNNIPYNKSIYNFIISLGLTLYLTTPQTKHICEFLFSAAQRDYNGKITHISEICFNSTHRTCIGKFLSNSPWNEDYILRALQKETIEKIWSLSKTTGQPIYVIIDDTICKKSKPSSQAKKIIQNCSFHYSHLENKQVYGHQVIAVLLQCGDITIPYHIKPYDKNIVDEQGEIITKIQIAIDTINSLPKPPNKSYVLADSWYSAEKIIKASINKNFHYIGALKTNRVIYPKQFNMNHQIKGFAKKLKEEDFHLVTVNKNSYYVYRYEGKINGFEKVIVLISYPKDALFNEKALRSFISTDTELSTEKILNQYINRWKIEVFFSSK